MLVPTGSSPRQLHQTERVRLMHGAFARYDVEISNTTIITSETIDEAGESVPDEDRVWAMVDVLWPELSASAEALDDTASSSLTFVNCRFGIDPTVEASDIVRVATTTGVGGALVFRDSEIDNCACEWFASDSCAGCSVD